MFSCLFNFQKYNAGHIFFCHKLNIWKKSEVKRLPEGTFDDKDICKQRWE